MELSGKWRLIIRRAWSVRLMVLAGIFTTAETMLPYFTDILPRGLFAVLTMLAVTGGLISRVVAQNGFDDE